MEERNISYREHRYYLDILRIFSALAVVGIHVSCEIKANSIIDEYGNITILSMFVWSVPVFFMISGCLFLRNDYNVSLKKLYSKNIVKLIVAGIVWSFIYFLYSLICANWDLSLYQYMTAPTSYHLWYIPVCISVYILIPLLKKISQDKRLLEYSIILIIISQSIIPTIVNLQLPYIEYFSLFINYFKIPLGFIPYVGYFLIGYYISEFELTKKVRIIIYVVGILGLVSTILLAYYSINVGYKTTKFMEYNYFNIFVQAVAIFLLFKNIFKDKVFKEKTKKIILFISKTTFGTYLIHLLVIKIFQLLLIKFPAQTQFVNTTFLLTPFYILLVFTISVVISALLKKIPIINKYIV